MERTERTVTEEIPAPPNEVRDFYVDLDNIKVEKKPGGSLHDTSLIKGIVLDKEVVHAGMPKRIEKAKIALVHGWLVNQQTQPRQPADLIVGDPMPLDQGLPTVEQINELSKERI